MTSSSRPVWMRFLGAHYPNFIKLAELANVIAIHQRSSQSSRVEPPAAVSDTHSRCAGTAEAANATGFPSGSAT
jgi:hypothetical protein